MATFSQAKIHNITWRLHKQRDLLVENRELRNKMLKSSYNMQLRNDYNAVQSHINYLQPGPRQHFLKSRLAKINAHFKQQQ